MNDDNKPPALGWVVSDLVTAVVLVWIAFQLVGGWL
jgi:hypothetical protein